MGQAAVQSEQQTKQQVSIVARLDTPAAFCAVAPRAVSQSLRVLLPMRHSNSSVRQPGDLIATYSSSATRFEPQAHTGLCCLACALWFVVHHFGGIFLHCNRSSMFSLI
jgi:hypothetical protein